MGSLAIERTINAPKSAVWDVLADFPNISSWNSGVKVSHATNEMTGGVGATRHCDLSPAGGLEERVLEWTPQSKMVIAIESAAKLPIKRGEASFSLAEAGGDTDFTLGYTFEPKGGPFASIVGKMMLGQLTKGFSGFIDDLEIAAQAPSAA
jgi:uncharacterized protein YndB with AHSA1/START domain